MSYTDDAGNSETITSEALNALSNDGKGSFNASGQSFGPYNAGKKSTLGDIDGDGDLDLIVSSNTVNSTKVYLNNGSGVFSDTEQSLGTANTYQTALGDIDGDGDLDLVAPSYSGNDKIYLNNGSGVFSESSTFYSGGIQSLELGDIDGDGDLH